MASLAIPSLSVPPRPVTNGNVSINDVIVGEAEIATNHAHVGDRRRLSPWRQFHLSQSRQRQFERWLMSAHTSWCSELASPRLDAKHKRRQERSGFGCGDEDRLLVRLHDVQPMVEILRMMARLSKATVMPPSLRPCRPRHCASPMRLRRRRAPPYPATPSSRR